MSVDRLAAHTLHCDLDGPSVLPLLAADSHFSALCVLCSLLQQLSTVGAIVVTVSGDVYAGVSSGGIWMKSSGRVGHVGQPHYTTLYEMNAHGAVTRVRMAC